MQTHTEDHKQGCKSSPIYRIWRTRDSQIFATEDHLVAEEPLEIRLGVAEPPGQPWVVTMRTPGQERELVYGLLWSEGITRELQDILAFRLCGPENSSGVQNTCYVQLNAAALHRVEQLQRNQRMNASCGLCGKESLAALSAVKFRNAISWPIEPQQIYELSQRFAQIDSLYRATGGCHACAFYNSEGQLEFFAEDVGRHNALDKLIGAALLSGRDNLSAGQLVLSGRVSYEMMQKAAAIQVSTVIALGAPTTLAVDLARHYNMNLIGFVKATGMNLYHRVLNHE